MAKWSTRARWVIAAFLTLYSFFASRDHSPFNWLTTPKGRLLVLLAALGVAFWPQLVAKLQEALVSVRPVSKRRLRRETRQALKDLRTYNSENPEPGFWEEAPARDEVFAQMQNAEDEAEKSRLWHQFNNERFVQRELRIRDIRDRFGGAVGFLVHEYARRNLLDQDEGHSFDFAMLTGNTVEIVERLDKLWRRL